MSYQLILFNAYNTKSMKHRIKLIFPVSYPAWHRLLLHPTSSDTALGSACNPVLPRLQAQFTSLDLNTAWLAQISKTSGTAAKMI